VRAPAGTNIRLLGSSVLQASSGWHEAHTRDVCSMRRANGYKCQRGAICVPFITHKPLFQAAQALISSSCLQVLTKVTTAAWSIAKSYFWGGNGNSSEQSSEENGASQPSKPPEPPRLVGSYDALDDSLRQVRTLRLEPQGRRKSAVSFCVCTRVCEWPLRFATTVLSRLNSE
jgi:hypothetical protein